MKVSIQRLNKIHNIVTISSEYEYGNERFVNRSQISYFILILYG